MGSSSDNGGRGGRTKVLVAAAVAVGGLGMALWALSSRAGGTGGGGGGITGGGYKKFMRSGALAAPADADPHFATQCALNAIRGGAVKSLGGLVYLLRGPAEVVPEGQKYKNAMRIRAPAGFIQFLQESYLRATAAGVAGDVGLPIERPMMSQLVACDAGLRRLERERATAFDNDSRAHQNLLQQLWLAAGKPLSSYARMGQQWTEFGFQGDDPATDLRGAGVLGLRQLVHFAQHQPQAMREMMTYNKRVADEHGDSWYLIAVVSFQFTAQLALQKDHPFYLNHLQVLYDTLSPTAATGSAATATTSAAAGAAALLGKTLSRESRIAELADKGHLTNREAVHQAWTDGEYVSDAEAGFFLLHEKLLLHFKACWEADKPHVMSYNTYVAEKVYGRFFTSSWSP